MASLYEAFAPEQAHRSARRLELHHTPRNGSWLNIAEIELSVLSEQCLRRRIPDVAPLDGELTAWSAARNAEGQYRPLAFYDRLRADQAAASLPCMHNFNVDTAPPRWCPNVMWFDLVKGNTGTYTGKSGHLLRN